MQSILLRCLKPQQLSSYQVSILIVTFTFPNEHFLNENAKEFQWMALGSDLEEDYHMQGLAEVKQMNHVV